MRFLLVSLTLLSVGSSARIAAADEFLQPNSVLPTALAYDNYYAQDVPPMRNTSAVLATDSPACGAAQDPACGCAAGCCDTCGDGCCNGCGRSLLPDGNPCFGSLLPCACCREPWKLIPDGCRWSVGGWVNGGVLTNADGFPNNNPVPFLSSNDFLMNQLWGYAVREADTGGYGFDWGARIDYVFGADGPDTQAFGDGTWDFGWDSGGRNLFHQTYGSAIPQAYVEVAINDLKVKMGRFYTIIGYEVVQATGNFFYTHAYTMNFGEPFTHTGFLGEYALNEDTTVYGGYVLGWDTGWENAIDAHMFMGGISLARWEDATLTWALTAGDNGFVRRGAGDQGDLYMQSIVLDWDLNDNWKYIFQTDLAIVGSIPGSREQHWYGVNQYLFYEINRCWSAGARVEIFRDEDGARVTGSRGNFWNASVGLNYKPTANIIVRPEVRGDWFDGSNAAQAPAYSGGTKTEQFMAGFDVIFTF